MPVWRLGAGSIFPGISPAQETKRDARIGVCFVDEGKPNAYNVSYYEDEFRPAEATQLSCENMLDGRRQP